MTKKSNGTTKKAKSVPGPSGKRLALVRRRAGFDSARSAALTHGWKWSTYASHENGQADPVPAKAAEKYGLAFGVEPDWIRRGNAKLAPDWYRPGMEDLPPERQQVLQPGRRKRVLAPSGDGHLVRPEIRLLEHSSAAAEPRSMALLELEQHKQIDMNNQDDGHRILDLSTAAGDLKRFLDDNMGPDRELWQVDSDAINLHIPEDSYVVIDTRAPVKPRALVLAELDTSEGPRFIFGSATARRLAFRSTTVRDPPFIPRTDRLRIIGPIVAAWSQSEETS